MNSSNIRQSIVRQSYVFNSGSNQLHRSFISTAVAGDSNPYGDQLRKSRIQNLPNYRKTNLGDNVQFIVVFQTIEIERLSQEIEVLRVKIKEYQRQLFNYSNYQVQIRELTEKCFTQEKEIYEYRQEYEKLNKICQTLYHENEMLKKKLTDIDFSLKQKYQAEKQKNSELIADIQKWKTRYQASERSKAKELEDLRAMMDTQRKSMIDRELREMTVRFQNERSGLESEIRKGRELLDNRSREVEDLRGKCQQYEIVIMELRQNEGLLADYENKIALVNQQLLRLNEVLKDREEQLQNQRNSEFKLTQELKKLQEWEYQGKQLRQTLQGKTKEVDEWKVRASRLQEEVVRGRQLEHYNQQLGNKLTLASKELERLNSILRVKIDEIEQWKRKVNDKDAEISKFKNLENEIYSYESKINNMKIENDRVSGILKSRLTEIEEWKGKYHKLEGQLAGLDGLKKEKKALEDRCNDYIRQNEEYSFKVTRLEGDVNTYRKNEGAQKEVQRKNQSLNQEIQRLNGLLRSQGNELNDFRVRYNKVESSLGEYRNIQVKVRDYEGKINLLTTELDKLNDLLKDRNREIAALQKEKLQLYSKINHYKNYQIKITQTEQTTKRLQDSNNSLKRELDGWQAKFRDGENKTRQMENHLFKSTQEKEKLSSMIKVKNNEYDELRQQYSRLEPELYKKREIQIALQEHQNHITGLMTDIEGYERRLRTYQGQIEKEKAFSNEFAFKIIVLSSEIERLHSENRGMSKVKSAEYEQLSENYTRLQNKVASKNAEIEGLIAKITTLQGKVSNLTSDYHRLLAAVQASQQQSVQLVRQIEEYQDYARRITILDAELDRLKAQNKSLDEDARRIRLKYAQGINQEKWQQAHNIKTVLMAVQIESLRRRIQEREINVEDMRKSILEPIRKV